MPERAQEPTEVRREVEVEASPEEVFEALVTEEGRERWLEEPDRADPHRVRRPAATVWSGGGASEDAPATRGRLPHRRRCPAAARVVVIESVPSLPARRDGRAASHAGGRLSDRSEPSSERSPIPTRRAMVEALLRDGSTSVPALSAELPISRQAVAKHLAALEQAGLLERLPGAGREVRYGLRGEALAPAAAWLRDAEASWDGRLAPSQGRRRAGPSRIRSRP